MRFFFDTSALVPVFLSGHEQHLPSARLFGQAHSDHCFCAAHTLVEIYSTITRVPPRDRVSPTEALIILRAVSQRLTAIALTPGEYSESLETYAAIGISGGGIYDAMLASCAVKAKADVIYTWNTRHYVRLGQEIAKLVATP